MFFKEVAVARVHREKTGKAKEGKRAMNGKIGSLGLFCQAAATMQATKTKRDKMGMCNYQTLSSNQNSWRQHLLFPISLACIGRLLKQI